MDELYGEFNKIVDADEYVKYNVASTRYSIKRVTRKLYIYTASEVP